MQQSTYSESYFADGSHTGPLSPSQSLLYDPASLSGNKYWNVTEPTGQYFSYVRDTTAGGPLADPGYGTTTSTAITTDQVEEQKRILFLKAVPMILLTMDSGGALLEASGLRMMVADETAAANTFFHYTELPIPAGQGLKLGSGVTTVGDLNASEAMFKLGIPPPNYVHPVTLENPLDFLIQDLGTPSRNGIPAWEVIKPTPPGSVGPPIPVPHKP